MVTDNDFAPDSDPAGRSDGKEDRVAPGGSNPPSRGRLSDTATPPASPIEALRSAVATIAPRLGIALDPASRNDPPTLVRLSLRWCGRVDLDEVLLHKRNTADAAIALLFRLLQDAQRAMFHNVVEHIATHDRDPLDRVRQLEAAARALLDEIGDVGFGRTADPLRAAMDLEMLLRAKPGAASWARHGYGMDPAPEKRDNWIWCGCSWWRGGCPVVSCTMHKDAPR